MRLMILCNFLSWMSGAITTSQQDSFMMGVNFSSDFVLYLANCDCNGEPTLREAEPSSAQIESLNTNKIISPCILLNSLIFEQIL